MKTATVPAQITTVEDKIAGNLTLQQIILLASPVFIDFACYAVLPPNLKLSIYKIVLMILVSLVMSTLAIRIKGKVLLVWALTIYRYNSRPRYHLFNKNSMHHRVQSNEVINQTIAPKRNTSTETTSARSQDELSQQDIAKLGYIFAEASKNLKFTTNKKGELHVNITEV